MPTGQANGTIHCFIESSKDFSVTFVPDKNYCVERSNLKFAVFLPISDGKAADEKKGFIHELRDDGTITFNPKGALGKETSDYFRTALLKGSIA